MAFCGKEKKGYAACLKNTISLLPINISDECLGVYPYMQSHTASWTQVFKGCMILTKIKQQQVLRMTTLCLYNVSVPGRSYRTHPALPQQLQNSSDSPSIPNPWFASLDLHTSLLLHVTTETILTFRWDDLSDHHHFHSHIIIIISYHHTFVTTVQ
jgi:hypothetical protein